MWLHIMKYSCGTLFVTLLRFSCFLHGSTVVVPNPKVRTIYRCGCGSTRIVTRCRSCMCVSITTDYPMCNISMFAGADFQDWRRMLGLMISLILHMFGISGSSTEDYGFNCWCCFFMFFFRNICLHTIRTCYTEVFPSCEWFAGITMWQTNRLALSQNGDWYPRDRKWSRMMIYSNQSLNWIHLYRYFPKCFKAKQNTRHFVETK